MATVKIFNLPSWGNWGNTGGGGEGTPGPAGPQGEKGDTGPAGAAGPKGDTGPAGAVGPKGDTGAAGAAGPTGAVGPKGDTGSQGEQGVQGEQGIQGAAGLGITFKGNVATEAELPSAGQVQGDLWVVATPAPATSRIWEAGTAAWVNGGPVQGPQGIAGPQGIEGPQGPAGVKGDTGAAGPAGPKGDTGAAGPKGDTGAAGPAGPTAIATATVLGGVKVGSGLAVAADGLLTASGGAASGAPLRLPPTAVSSFNGIDAYFYYDTASHVRLQIPSGITAFRIDSIGDFTIPKSLFVTGAGAFAGTVNLAGNGTTSSLTFGATTLNLTVGTGGIAWRNNTSNIQIITAASITNNVSMVTPPSGNGVVFGSGGAAFSRGSAITKIAATGMIELPTTAPLAAEAIRKDFADATYAPKVALDEMKAEIEALRAEIANLKAV